MTRVRHSTDREVALMILMAYLSYMLAEVRSFFLNLNLTDSSTDHFYYLFGSYFLLVQF